MNTTVKRTVRGALIAALYACITVFMPYQLSFGPVQARLSEALTLLPFIMPEAVAGLTVGCFIANIFGGNVLDIVFGTLATFIASFLTSKMKKIWLCPLPAVIANGLIVGAAVTLITYRDFSLAVYGATVLSISVSETVICYCMGIPLTVFISQLSKKVPFLR